MFQDSGYQKINVDLVYFRDRRTRDISVEETARRDERATQTPTFNRPKTKTKGTQRTKTIDQ